MESGPAERVTDDEALRLAREVADRLMESAGGAAEKPDLADGAPGIALAPSGTRPKSSTRTATSKPDSSICGTPPS
ncbi:hypothetical protein IHE61_01050 [Streptomyces sp. GKU 257-1]|nr:hypothetical protein [Streptomyces sp. GKU 257-1]